MAEDASSVYLSAGMNGAGMETSTFRTIPINLLGGPGCVIQTLPCVDKENRGTMMLNCCCKLQIQDQIVLQQHFVQTSGAKESAEFDKPCIDVTAERRPRFSRQSCEGQLQKISEVIQKKSKNT